MSMYIKQIEQLVVLQGVDNEIVELENLLSGAPKEIQGLEDQLTGLQGRLAILKDKVDILQAQKNKIERDIEEDDFKVKKSKNKLMMVENTKEYHAVLREVDNLEKTNRMREEERVTISEELALQEKEFAELKEKVDTLAADIQQKKASYGEQVEASQKRLNDLSKKREKAGKSVPLPIMGRYNFIRSRISNPVIVPVSNGVCNGCHISIPPQSYIELQKGQQILSCPNCQRLIYWSEHFSAKEDK